MDLLKGLKAKYGIPNPEYRIDDDYLILSISLTKIIDKLKPIIDNLKPKELKIYLLLKDKQVLPAQTLSNILSIDERTARRYLSKFVKLGLAETEGRGSKIVYKAI
jgi:predicted HTH transcriptional regulator